MARTVNKEQTAKRKEQILLAAFDCFGRKGFHQTSMQEICKKAKLSPGTVYHYFQSKDEIIEHIADREVKKSTLFSTVLAQASTLREGLEQTVDMLLFDNDSGTSFQIYMEVVCEAGRNRGVRKKLLKSDTIALKAIKKRLAEEDLTMPGVSTDVLAEFIGAQIELLEMYKRYEPTAEHCSQMATATKRIISMLFNSME